MHQGCKSKLLIQKSKINPLPQLLLKRIGAEQLPALFRLVLPGQSLLLFPKLPVGLLLLLVLAKGFGKRLFQQVIALIPGQLSRKDLFRLYIK